VPVNDLRLDLLGTSFFITTDEDPVYLQEILDQYRTVITGIQENIGLKDPLNTAILTGFLLCDEVHKLRNRGKPPEEDEAERLTLNLIARIDKALENKTPAHE
jgi:hypothetical protein